MRGLTDKEFSEAPSVIQYLMLASMGNMLIGYSTYNKAIEEHPEYFPDEVAYRKKWDAVPEEVKAAHDEELRILNEQLLAEFPESAGKGLFWHMKNDPVTTISFPAGKDISQPPNPEYVAWQKGSDAHKKKMALLETGLWNKHFGPYGLSK